jgi:hypothetical protein
VKRLAGCPMGCPLDHHECGVGEPIRRRGPYLYVTVDERRRLLLLRGDGAPDVCEALSLRATYSRAGGGRVVGVEHLADVVAYCEHRHELCVVTERKAS